MCVCVCVCARVRMSVCLACWQVTCSSYHFLPYYRRKEDNEVLCSGALVSNGGVQRDALLSHEIYRVLESMQLTAR